MRSICPSRRSVLATGTCALMAGGLWPTKAHADLALRGTAVQWRGTLPGDWIGGNIDMVEAVIKNPPPGTTRKLYEPILGRLKFAEVACVHRDVSGLTTPSISTLEMFRMNLTGIKLSQDVLDIFWKGMIDRFKKTYPRAKDVQLGMQDPKIVIGGRPAAVAVFGIEHPEGASFEAIHLVDVGNGVGHRIEVAADSSKIKARLDEAFGLFRSIKYG